MFLRKIKKFCGLPCRAPSLSSFCVSADAPAPAQTPWRSEGREQIWQRTDYRTDSVVSRGAAGGSRDRVPSTKQPKITLSPPTAGTSRPASSIGPTPNRQVPHSHGSRRRTGLCPNGSTRRGCTISSPKRLTWTNRKQRVGLIGIKRSLLKKQNSPKDVNSQLLQCNVEYQSAEHQTNAEAEEEQQGATFWNRAPQSDTQKEPWEENILNSIQTSAFIVVI